MEGSITFKKLNFKKGIDISKVHELKYFSTHANINYHLDKYMNKHRNSIKKGSDYYKEISNKWTDELETKIVEVLKNTNFISKYPHILGDENRKISFDHDKTFSYGGLMGNNINVLNLSILLMVILEEDDINKVLNSKEFEITLSMIQDYIEFIEEYLKHNEASIIQFIDNKKLGIDSQPSDFDSLNLLVWKFFRDVEALKYANRKTPLRYRSFTNKIKDTLLAIYLSCCIAKLNNFAF